MQPSFIGRPNNLHIQKSQQAVQASEERNGEIVNKKKKETERLKERKKTMNDFVVMSPTPDLY